MSFRDVHEDLGDRLLSIERQIRELSARVSDLDRRVTAIETSGALPPDPNWRLVQVGTDMQYLYVPTGVYGPVIASQ